ncbi:carbonic anhydrase [Dissulfurispira thermophila]|uniref:Carbonic anhydrase n=1 Tax=Dissulfurispira thermophila TaxID=2715679 RepID=A0A7G1H159_9BACT|nr:acetyltransferase [Dissulfurispira thermophila]BCB96338.1 carbonic anhydrase [Dissulfurispira thermophila]
MIDLIKTSCQYEIVGILDAQLDVDSEVSGVTVLGDDSVLLELYGKGIKHACIAIGSVKDNSKRKAMYEKVKHAGFSIPTLIHPSAIISDKSQILEGVQVMAGAIVQTNALIGENTIVNTRAIVEHDCIISSHVHICSGAVMSGGCIIGEGTFIGAGATVIHGIKIGKGALIGAGSVVITNVPDGAAVKGVPAK